MRWWRRRSRRKKNADAVSGCAGPSKNSETKSSRTTSVEHYGDNLTLGTADDSDIDVDIDAPNVNLPNVGGGGGICSRSRWC